MIQAEWGRNEECIYRGDYKINVYVRFHEGGDFYDWVEERAAEDGVPIEVIADDGYYVYRAERAGVDVFYVYISGEGGYTLMRVAGALGSHIYAGMVHAVANGYLRLDPAKRYTQDKVDWVLASMAGNGCACVMDELLLMFEDRKTDKQ